MKWLWRPIRNIGACITTPPVTMMTPRTNAQIPRRSDRVLVLTIVVRNSSAASAVTLIERQERFSARLRGYEGCGGESAMLTQVSISGVRRGIHAADGATHRGSTRLKLE